MGFYFLSLSPTEDESESSIGTSRERHSTEEYQWQDLDSSIY